MTHYDIRYEANNSYQHVVNEALFEFSVLPATTDTQLVNDVRIENSLDVPVFSSRNVFGYEVLFCRIAQPFTHLTFSVSCTVRRLTQRVLPNTLKCLPRAEEQRVLQSEGFLVDHYLYIQQTSLTSLAGSTLPASLAYQHDRSLFDYVNSLNQSVYEMMEYQPLVTTTNTQASEVLTDPRGVCQDYSHLMLGILRHHRIPSRYVSGYLNQGQQFQGATQLHAWVEVFIPVLGWVGFDPTNNLLTDQHHIKVADGPDYTDCSPLKGYINPGVMNTTGHIVQVVEQ